MKQAPQSRLSPRSERLKAEVAGVIASRRKEIERSKKRSKRGRGLSSADLEAIRDGKR